HDSVQPFLEFADKWTIVLALTSNTGSIDCQTITDTAGTSLFEQVLQKTNRWGNPSNLMYVVGATRGKSFEAVRKVAPEHFLLVPGVGAQGGSLSDVCRYGMNSDCGLLVNATRSIIYASSGTDFATRAREEALSLQQEMERELKAKGII